MTEAFTLTAMIPATPLRVYEAWLDEREHGAFTGSKAQAEPGIGGAFTAWDGYIRGRTLELSEGQRILQSWRTSEFPPGSEDSLLEILLEEGSGGTRLTLRHSGIPEGQGESYEQGWIDHYFDPLKRYFAALAPKAARRLKPAKKAAKAKRGTARRKAVHRRKPARAPRRAARPERGSSGRRKPKSRKARNARRR
ncbi:MAG: SRPBCC domain-containing protein [Myxococcales bacterium]